MLQAARQDTLKALYVVGANPVLGLAYMNDAQKVMGNIDFLVVQDIFLSQTAQLAKVVLPACSFAETDGTYTNFEGRIQQVRQAIDPLGESRPDWWIVAQIAKRLQTSGFEFQNSAEVMEEISQLVPQYAAVRDEAKRGKHSASSRSRHSTNGAPETDIAPAAYNPSMAQPDDEYPLALNIEHSLYRCSMSTRVDGFNVLRPAEVVEINPSDAGSRGIGDGERVRIVSQQGDMVTAAKVTRNVPTGTISVTIHSATSPANRLAGIGMDPISGIAELKSCAVRIERVVGT
jgi:predicted molibdopterin-dependent oxidoreductase YjgC